MSQKNFEMAHTDNPEEVIMATQRSLIEGLRHVAIDLKNNTKAQGLTWEQLDCLLVAFGNKKPKIVYQEHEQ